jgi:hypothetical protein
VTVGGENSIGSRPQSVAPQGIVAGELSKVEEEKVAANALKILDQNLEELARKNAPPDGKISEEGIRASEFTSSDRPTVFETRPAEELHVVEPPKPKDEW